MATNGAIRLALRHPEDPDRRLPSEERIRAIRDRYLEQEGREPTVAEVAGELELNEWSVEEWLRYLRGESDHPAVERRRRDEARQPDYRRRDEEGRYGCKIDGCEGRSAQARGRYAYLCDDVHAPRARARAAGADPDDVAGVFLEQSGTENHNGSGPQPAVIEENATVLPDEPDDELQELRLQNEELRAELADARAKLAIARAQLVLVERDKQWLQYVVESAVARSAA